MSLSKALSILGGVSGKIVGLRHTESFGISTQEERTRFSQKACNLGLLYASGFQSTKKSFPERITETIRFAKAGVICALYDVVTDWGEKYKDKKTLFQDITIKLCGENSERITMELYQKDTEDLLAFDGLERGEATLIFLREVTESDFFENMTPKELQDLGHMLQLADDILVYEEDRLNNDHNCLLNMEKRAEYIDNFINFVDNERYFGEDSYMKMILKKSKEKAQGLVKDFQYLLTMKEFSYRTGCERYDKNGEIDIDASMQAILNEMKKRNPEKYGNFIDSLNKQALLLKTMGVPDREERLKLFKYTYCAMRLLDDICDDDLTIKLANNIKEGIISQAAGEKVEDSQFGLYEVLEEKIKDTAENIGVGEGMSQVTRQIARSLMFDFNRSIDSKKTRSRKDLEENFDMMDIIGTEYGTAIIMGLDPKITLERLKELGVACRISYNIKDLIDDLVTGLINISEEDLQKFDITLADIDNVKKYWEEGKLYNYSELMISGIHEGIKSWLSEEILRMDTLVEEFKVKYSVGGIIFGKQSIPATYKQSLFRKKFNNLVLRFLVLPQVYLKDIQKSKGQ